MNSFKIAGLINPKRFKINPSHLNMKPYTDLDTFQRELMLFLRGIRKHKQESSTLITDNFHIVQT